VIPARLIVSSSLGRVNGQEEVTGQLTARRQLQARLLRCLHNFDEL
jgi:hypothetical protein